MTKKSIFLKILLVLIFFINIFYSIALADDFNEIEADKSTITEQIVETSSEQEDIPSINSKSAVVLDRNSKQILYGKNENEKRKMASTTKIMTSIIIIENCNLHETVEISKKAASTGGSILGIKTGDKITILDLLYGLMLKSRQ